jgi:EAL domain-containing protein (putative c-di-GMP-specific phosphodiesterase class I)
MILPEIFIPLAEKTGLINSIGEWVLRPPAVKIRRGRNRDTAYSHGGEPVRATVS